MRQILSGLAWLVAVIGIALGAAGLVTAMNAPAAAGARPWLTARDDVVVDGRLDAIAADLAQVSGRIDELGAQARIALSALVANDPTAAADALDAGDDLVGDIRVRTGLIAEALRDVPVIGTPEAEYRLGPAVRERHGRLTQALASTRGLDVAWASLATGSATATRLSHLLAAHDDAALAATEFGRGGKYENALRVLEPAETAIRDARRLRDQLARTVDVATLDQWLDRSADYDKALRELYESLRDSEGRVTKAVRTAMAAEREARDRLPPDTRGLVLIMAEIGRGGMNEAVISIEQARGALAEALADPTATEGP